MTLLTKYMIYQYHQCFYLFPSKQFHVLLNSLFKVLFNFPSRYLFAIGLTVIFSLRWSLPPALSCTPKQLDSQSALTNINIYSHRTRTVFGSPSQGSLE